MDMSLQEYLNHETLRLKKDRTKLNESTRIKNNSNRLFDEIINEKNSINNNRDYMNTTNKKGKTLIKLSKII